MAGAPVLDLVPYLVLGVPAIELIRWYLYWRFCRYVLDRTNDPKALAEVAAAARPYRRLPRVGDKP